MSATENHFINIFKLNIVPCKNEFRAFTVMGEIKIFLLKFNT